MVVIPTGIRVIVFKFQCAVKPPIVPISDKGIATPLYLGTFSYLKKHITSAFEAVWVFTLSLRM